MHLQFEGVNYRHLLLQTVDAFSLQIHLIFYTLINVCMLLQINGEQDIPTIQIFWFISKFFSLQKYAQHLSNKP
jgi:hypothetical protein